MEEEQVREDLEEGQEQIGEDGAAPEGLDLARVKHVLETALLVTQEPMSLNDLKKLFDEKIDNGTLRKVLDDLRDDWDGRGVELVSVASGWRFRARPESQRFLDRLNPQKPPKYSRAVLETIAIIAYKQPVTRGDIEEIRGVTVSPGILKALEARGWIDVIGHREVPGRPEIFATTKSFLDDLNLRSLEELPPLSELGSLVEQNPNAEMDLEAALAATLPSASMAEGVMDADESDDDAESGDGAEEFSASAEMPEEAEATEDTGNAGTTAADEESATRLH
jgi:segregation and condensation protein B